MASANRGVVFQQIDRLYREGTLSGLRDGQLLERYLSRRDEAAFEALVNLHGPMVLGLCRRVLRDPRDVEDAFQATFLVLVRKAPTIRDRGLLSNWLYGVAYRVARRARTNTLRRREREFGAAKLEASAVPESADVLGIGPVLDQELTRLPQKYRAPLILCYLKGRTHDEAAEDLGCPVGTVRSRLARGRDLLRRRLTSRGYAPTAAILGSGTSLPAQLLSEAVPSSLVATTVDAAFRVGALQSLQAGAASASVLALTQGVLTTMKLAQLKWIGLAIVATGISAGGGVAVSFARAQTSRTTSDENSAAVVVPDPQTKAAPRRNPKPAVMGNLGSEPFDALEMAAPRRNPKPAMMGNLGSERFDALEQKVDELLKRLGGTPVLPATTVTTSTRAVMPDSSTARVEYQRPSNLEATSRTIVELETEFRLAMENYDRAEQLFEQKVISTTERDRAKGRFLLIAAVVEGLEDDMDDDIERLKLETKKKQAEIDKGVARTYVARSKVARNKRLNERKPGMVSEEDVAEMEAEFREANAHANFTRIELADAELRLKQLQRRRVRIKQLTKLADRFRPAGPPASPTPAGGDSPR